MTRLLEALADVKAIRQRVLERQLFCGYSGIARITGGCLALLGAATLALGIAPSTPEDHVLAWGIIGSLAALINFSSLAHWFRSQDIELGQLRPVLDLLAPFIVGGLITFALLSNREYDLLFPIWMWVYGLMNISSRHSMPKAMVYLGWYYILTGTLCILLQTSFLNPWPMGLTFFIGELIGGITFIKMRKMEDR